MDFLSKAVSGIIGSLVTSGIIAIIVTLISTTNFKSEVSAQVSFLKEETAKCENSIEDGRKELSRVVSELNKRLEEHSKADSEVSSTVKAMEKNIQEIKADVRELRNRK